MIIATNKQIDYVTVLRDRLHLNHEWFIGYCVATYGAEPLMLDFRSCSALIGEMQDWDDHPEKLLRAQGQQSLFEVPS